MRYPSSALRAIACCVAWVGAGGNALAGEWKCQTRAGEHASLIELYTSEGCSSCPPAESWLSRLTASPQLWTRLVPVAFHVDYWDGLGWRDRFASTAWTARQRAYAASWGSTSIYTPGLVLDGLEWRGWSSVRDGALPSTPGTSRGTGLLEIVVRDEKTATVAYRPTERPTAAREATIALLGCDLNSDVKAGENRGRALRHDFVVLASDTKKLVAGKADETAVFDLSAPPADARRLALAAWVVEPGRAGVEQATGGWLRDTPVKGQP